MASYAIGLDFGTNSCRSLVVEMETGRELASSVFPNPLWYWLPHPGNQKTGQGKY